MPRCPFCTSVAVASALAGILLAGPAAAGDDTEAAFGRVIRDHADAIVTVKLVLTMKGGFFGADGERSEVETSAVMVDPRGIVLASNSELGGLPASVRRILNMLGGEISVVPSDIKVLVGDDTEGLDGELFARDSELDLAWVRIKDPGGRSYRAIDLAKSADAALGQPLLALTRMDRYFGSVPVVEELHVAGVTTKPRRLYVPDDSLGVQLGTPIFTTDGALVGITQSPDMDSAAVDPLAAAQLDDLEAVLRGFILPAEDVRKATRQALEVAGQAGDAGPDVPGE